MSLGSYSLILYFDGKIIFSSTMSGLRPLFECITKCKDYRGCVLHDKVIGAAAARMIRHSGIITKVITPICSKAGRDVLIEGKTELEAQLIVDSILKKDKSGTCPMELRASQMDDDEFWEFVSRIYSV